MYTIKKNKVGKFYFTINARSGKILTKSKDTYFNKESVYKAIQSCQTQALSDKITEEL